MISRTALSFVAASSFALFACSSDDSSDNTPSPDAGFQTTPPDSGVIDITDAGFVDQGVAGPCDPLTGGGCSGSLSCVYVVAVGGVTVDEPQCRDLGAANAIGGACDPSNIDCVAGATCIVEQDGPVCRKVCRPAMDNADCSSLPDQHACVALNAGSGEFGWCVPVEACDPLNDTCPAGEACGFVGEGELGCVTEGANAVGQSCAMGGCARGGICINLGGTGATCYRPCDTMGPDTCGQTSSCTGLQNLNFGVCIEDVLGCDPVNDTCAAGERCTIVAQGQAECRPAGNVPRGGDCSNMSCARGNVCINANNTGATCYQPCREGTVCEMGTCANTLDGFDFSICFGG